ncbi:MAG: SEC-C motif-containing protein [Motiliproteus sp.]|jgi:SEC-C motif-containing protein
MTENPAILESDCNENSAHTVCPCGSQQPYQHCCQAAISGRQPARSAEALMRSRYSAFVMAEADYLIASTHPDYRQALSRASMIDPQIRWRRLQIITTQQGTENDQEGQVRFIATYVEGGRFGTLEENSNFSRIDSHWYYRDGDTRSQTLKPQRNAPCPCGSALKFKHCCRQP